MTAYLELTKPRLVFLVLWTVAVGFLLGTIGPLNLRLLLRTLTGTGLVAAGSMVLNQYLERESDARMKRTENRPLPSGRVKPNEALAFGLFLSLAGLLVLAFSVNLLTCFLSALTLVSYLFLYTPLKQRTPWSTFAGAIPGAIPPMLGWGAARGELGGEHGSAGVGARQDEARRRQLPRGRLHRADVGIGRVGGRDDGGEDTRGFGSRAEKRSRRDRPTLDRHDRADVPPYLCEHRCSVTDSG